MACTKGPCATERAAALLRREMQARQAKGGEQNDGVQLLLQNYENDFSQQEGSRKAYATDVRTAVDHVGSTVCVRQEDLRWQLLVSFKLYAEGLRHGGKKDAADEVDKFLCFLLRQPELVAAGAEGETSPHGETASTVDTDGDGCSRESDSTDFGAPVAESTQEEADEEEEEEFGIALRSRSRSCPDFSDWRSWRSPSAGAEPSDSPVEEEEEALVDYFSDTDSEYGCSYEAPEALLAAWTAAAVVPPAAVAPADPVQMEHQAEAPPPPPVPVAAASPSADAFWGLQACAECGKTGFVPDPSKMDTYTPEQLANAGPATCAHWLRGLTNAKKGCNCRKCKFCHHH